MISFLHILLYLEAFGSLPDSNVLWSLVCVDFVLTVLWSLLLLKYYQYKTYRATFWLMLLYIITLMIQFGSLYNFIITRELTYYYIYSSVLAILQGLTYAISLIVSEARQRQWLKIAGIYYVLIEIVSMISFLWAVNSVSARLNGTIAVIEQSTSLLRCFGPLFFIINFYRERQEWRGGVLTSRILPLIMLMTSFFTFAIFVVIVPKIWMNALQHSPDAPMEGVRQDPLSFESHSFVSSNGEELQYRLLMPVNYDSTRRYPLVVCLHGSSGSGSDNVKQIYTSLPARVLSTELNRKKYPAFVFVPQCPENTSWGGISGLRSIDYLVFGTIKELLKRYSIDSSRLYVAGNSMGGYGTWHFITKHPDLFAAAIPISGACNSNLANLITDVPVWAFHSTGDRNVPVEGSREMIAAMRRAGGQPLYTEYDQSGHDITLQILAEPELLNWLFGQSRK